MKQTTRRLFILAAAVLTGTLLMTGAELTLTAPRSEEGAEADADGDRVNVLIMGCDRATGLTDVLLLLSLDRKRDRAAVMQLPRDTYAEYSSASYKKLNGAYGALGGEGVCRFLSSGLGVEIDRYAALSPDALVELVDALGGVELTLEEPMRYSDPEQGLYISLEAGRQVLDGAEAEQFIRYRSGYADGDLGRLDAQKQFLCALAVSARKNADPLTALRLTAALVGGTDTNISAAEGASLVEAMLELDYGNVFMMTAPGEAAVASLSGASYYSLSRPAMSETLGRYFSVEAGAFDREGVFLNERYDHFCDIYGGYSTPRVYTAKNLLEDE